MPFHRDAWWLMGSAVAAIAAAPLIVQGDAQTSAQRAAAAQKIEMLSPADRQELEENFKRFEKLPAAEQTKYREIHARIEQNPAVSEALSAFSQWWPTVSAREQADLFNQQDVKQRIAVVSTIQEEIDRDRGGRMFFGRGWGGRDGFRMNWSLPRESFFQIMQTLEGLASESYLIEKELPEIQKLDVKNPQRYVKLFTALHEKNKNWFDLVPNPSVESRVADSISDEKVKAQVREWFRPRTNERYPSPKHFWIRLHLGLTLGREVYLEMMKQNYGEAELAKKLAGLSKDERDELYALSAEDSRFQLKMRILRDIGKESKAEMPPVQEFFQLSDIRPPWERGRGDDRGRGGDGPMGRGGEGPGRSEGPPPRD